MEFDSQCHDQKKMDIEKSEFDSILQDGQSFLDFDWVEMEEVILIPRKLITPNAIQTRFLHLMSSNSDNNNEEVVLILNRNELWDKLLREIKYLQIPRARRQLMWKVLTESENHIFFYT